MIDLGTCVANLGASGPVTDHTQVVTATSSAADERLQHCSFVVVRSACGGTALSKVQHGARRLCSTAPSSRQEGTAVSCSLFLCLLGHWDAYVLVSVPTMDEQRHVELLGQTP